MTIVKKSIPLSEDGSFEKIVNAGTEKYRRKTSLWVNKAFKTIIAMFFVELVVLLLCNFRVISNLSAVMVSEVITCVVSFLGGRMFEQVFK